MNSKSWGFLSVLLSSLPDLKQAINIIPANEFLTLRKHDYLETRFQLLRPRARTDVLSVGVLKGTSNNGHTRLN